MTQKYTEDFERGAMAPVVEHGYKVTEAAQSLGIGNNQLGRWKRGLEEQASGARLSPDERDELKRLRRENRNLRMEKEILKKASQYFAKEMNQLHHRGKTQLQRKVMKPKSYKATGPNQVWSWDIVYLAATLAGAFFRLD